MIRYFAFLVIFIAQSVYLLKFYPWNGSSVNKAKWGIFGDFAGGVANPILTLFTTIVLVRSINLQKEANDSIIKQSSHMHKVSGKQKGMGGLRSLEPSSYSLAEVSRREFDALKIVGRNKKVYSAADAVVYLEGYLLNARKSKTSKELTGQFSKFDTDSSMTIFSAAQSFCILFKFINESYPDNHKEGYYKIANHIISAKFPHLVYLACVFGNQKIINDFERYGFFKRKDSDEYVFNFTCVKNYY